MKKNIIFYCHNFWWLWHTKRLSLIIKEILNNFWDFYNVIFLNSWKEQDFLLKDIKWLKVINLPTYHFDNYQIINWKKQFLLRKIIFKKIFSTLNVEKLIIEHYPFWRNFLDHEIKYLIWIYKKYNNRWIVFSSVRDIIDINSLNKENLNLFDRFLIHWDKNIINYDNSFDKNIKNNIIYTGYIVDNIKNNYEQKDFILISIWWGQDWFSFIIDFLEKYKQLDLDYKIFVNLWLNYNNKNLEKIKKIAISNIEIKDYFENFIDLKQKARIIVSMWGYNNFLENIYYNKVSLIYSRETDEEQQKRLKLFKEKGYSIYDAKNIKSFKFKNILLW
jgi:predicted glycosyltransferase